jgi:hypothetical protein
VTGTDLYLYGIVRTGHRLPEGLAGVGRPPETLRLLTSGDVTAVVSAAPHGLRARRRDLLAHQDLLLALADDGPVLPMRFGCVAPDRETVREQLSAAGESHLRALDQVAGRHELNVKASVAEEGMAALIREDPRLRRLRDAVRRSPGYEASLRLGEAVATGLERRARQAAAQVVDDLSAHAVVTVDGPEGGDYVRNTSFLVDVDAGPSFRAAAERLANRHTEALRLRITGPLPCYSFVPTEPGVGTAAPVGPAAPVGAS